MTASDAPLSLSAYVDLNTKPSCSVCALPHDTRIELQQARATDLKRYTYRVIAQWLATQGHEVHPDALRRHFNNGHHRPPARGRD